MLREELKLGACCAAIHTVTLRRAMIHLAPLKHDGSGEQPQHQPTCKMSGKKDIGNMPLAEKE